MRKLSASLENLDVDYFIMPIRNQGNWYLNTAYKATFIREMLDCYPDKNIVFVDADSIFHCYPVRFDLIRADIAYHLRLGRRNYPEGEVLSGTLFFQNNQKARMICSRWMLENKRNPDIWEQRNLRTALESIPNISVELLTAAYCKIFDAQDQIVTGQIVIEHFQKSRQYKKEVWRKK
jgi:hypothetical protein